jgi:hypothetical protein
MPSTILEIPLRNSANAARSIRIAMVNIGNCIRIIDNLIISNTIPILTRRENQDNGCTVPIASHSISIASNITERIIMIEKTAGPVYSRI